MGPVVDEDVGGLVGAELQGLLHQGDVLHPPAWLQAERRRHDHLGLGAEGRHIQRLKQWFS